LDDLISGYFLPGNRYTEMSFTDELQSLNIPWNQFSWVCALNCFLEMKLEIEIS